MFDIQTSHAQGWVRSYKKIVSAIYIFAGILLAFLAIFENDSEEIFRYITDWDERAEHPYMYSKKGLMNVRDEEANNRQYDEIMYIETVNGIEERQRFIKQESEIEFRNKEKLGKIKDDKKRVKRMMKYQAAEDARLLKEEIKLRDMQHL